MKTIIEIKKLSKKYHIGERAPYLSLRDSLSQLFSKKKPSKDFWALKDVNLSIQAGDVIGVIGRNGAGKSTLLKILAKITSPTEGSVHVHGKIGTLLEVGTGFHPELTGRENIFLSGAILGMSQKTIQRRFDEIVDFSGVERFLSLPVKRYSSGMYTRLAFSVAAHLDSDILLIDEILAVGDASFQKKCMEKMGSVTQSGRTILFVSHNTAAVARLCNRCIVLDKGQLVANDVTANAISYYLRNELGSAAQKNYSPEESPGNSICKLRSVRISNSNHEPSDTLNIFEEGSVEMTYEVLEGGHVLVPNFHFYNEEGQCIFVINDMDPEWRKKPKAPGLYRTAVTIPANFLAEGTIYVGFAVCTMDPLQIHFFERDLLAFQVIDSMDGTTARGDYGGPMIGAVRPILPTTTQTLS